MTPKVFIDRSEVAEGLSGRGVVLGAASSPISDQASLQVLSLIATPACPSGTSQAAWSRQHVKNLRPMCVGGVDVIGAYTGDETPRAQSIAASVATSASVPSPIVLSTNARGKVVARDAHTHGTSAQSSIDVKFTDSSSERMVNISAVLTIPDLVRSTARNAKAESLRQAEKECAERMVSFIEQCVVRVPDVIRYVTDDSDETPLSEFMGWERKPAKKGRGALGARALSVEILTPLTAEDEWIGADDGDEEQDDQNVSVGMEGAMAVRAVVSENCTCGTMLRALRDDAVRSLRARYSVIADIDADAEEDGEGLPKNIGSRSLPARVFAVPVNPASSLLPMCDYAVHGDDIEMDIRTRFQEILSWADNMADTYRLEEAEELANEVDGLGECEVDENCKSDNSELASVTESSSHSVERGKDVGNEETLTPTAQLGVYAIGVAIAIAILALLIKLFVG